MRREKFGFSNFAWRWLVALLLVLAVYNPSGYSYVGWWLNDPEGMISVRVLAGLALLVVLVMYLRATFRSIGPVGILLATAILAALVWLLVDLGVVDPSQQQLMIWIGLVVIATVMAIGMSWSHVRRRLSGQVDTDDLED